MAEQDSPSAAPEEVTAGADTKNSPKQSSAKDADKEQEQEAAASAGLSPQLKNAYPAMAHSNKPPFDIGPGWLDWADRKAAQIFEAVWDGAKDYFDGKGRVEEMEAQDTKHHGHVHHKSFDDPSSPPKTPPGDPQLTGGKGKSSGFRSV